MEGINIMATISQPVWVLVGLIGIADLCLFWWCIILLRRSRKSNERSAAVVQNGVSPGQSYALDQFQHNLVGQQIDAVFNGLAALIETERIKLKSLIRPMTSFTIGEPAAVNAHPDAMEAPSEIDPPQVSAIGQQVVQFAASGKKPNDIAHQLGISLAEVNLAMQFQSAIRSQSGRKLEAVA